MTQSEMLTIVDFATGRPAARRQQWTYAALNAADAAQAGLLRLVAEIARLRALLGEDLDDAALYAVRRALGDLRQCAEALGAGIQ